MQVPAELRRTGRYAESTIPDPTWRRRCAPALPTTRHRLQRLRAPGPQPLPAAASPRDRIWLPRRAAWPRRLAAGHGTTVTRRNHRTVGP